MLKLLLSCYGEINKRQFLTGIVFAFSIYLGLFLFESLGLYQHYIHNFEAYKFPLFIFQILKVINKFIFFVLCLKYLRFKKLSLMWAFFIIGFPDSWFLFRFDFILIVLLCFDSFTMLFYDFLTDKNLENKKWSEFKYTATFRNTVTALFVLAFVVLPQILIVNCLDFNEYSQSVESCFVANEFLMNASNILHELIVKSENFGGLFVFVFYSSMYVVLVKFVWSRSEPIELS